jgi:hypothetical protein
LYLWKFRKKQNCLLKLVADQIKKRLRKGTAEFQRMETRKRSVWYQRGCNIVIFPQPPEKMCQLVDVDEVFHAENNIENTQQSGHIKIWKNESLPEKSI